MSVRYISLFSGAGISDVGFDRAGWECLAQVEIDKQANDVRKRHFPDVQHFEDVRSFDAKQFHGRVDAVVGGFPCQDYSVAGQRGGLVGDRGALWWEFHRVVREARPRLVVGENVPGLLSSGGGRDFGAIVQSLVELGYRVAWRVLDLRYFGVPQRRRRVFIVASLGSGSCAEILFEPESLQRHPAESREKRESDTRDVAGCLRASSPDSDPDIDTYIPEVANSLRAEGFDASEDGTGRQTYIAGTLSANTGGTTRPAGNANELDFCVAEPYAIYGVNARKDRPNGGFYATETDQSKTLDAASGLNPTASQGGMAIVEPIPIQDGRAIKKEQNGVGMANEGDPSYTLDHTGAQSVAEPIGFTQNSRDEVRSLGDATGALAAEAGMKQQTFLAEPFIYQHSSGGGDGEKSTAQALRANAEHSYQVLAEPIPIKEVNANQWSKGNTPGSCGPGIGASGDPMYALGATPSNMHGVAEPVAFYGKQGTQGGGISDDGTSVTIKTESIPAIAWERPYAPTLNAQVPNDSSNIQTGIRQGWRVRRLTPVECERLMGLPDGYTESGASGKAIADGPRYKMLGNGWSVPQAEWLGRRVMEVKE